MDQREKKTTKRKECTTECYKKKEMMKMTVLKMTWK